MTELAKYLLSIDADDYFNVMGLSVDNLFLKDSIEKNPYCEHLWYLKKSEEVTAVNAIPDLSNQDRLFWEEWYIYQGEVHHHILTLYKPEHYDEIFNCPEKDSIHPPLSFGKTWYVVEDKDMRPLLLRR